MMCAIRVARQRFVQGNRSDSVKTTQGDNVKYSLFSVPIYLAERTLDLVESQFR